MEKQEGKFDMNFLHFDAQGFIDYGPDKLTEPVVQEPFWWEEIDWKYWASAMNRNYYYPVYISAVYLVVIFGLKEFMKNRKAFELKKPLALWNGALGLFSIMGVIRVFPDFWTKVSQPNGIYKSLCVKDDMSAPMAFFAAMFIFSKIVELGDTLFIVLRKRPLKFLQWYHHAMSLTLAWTTGPYLEPICRYYILMNYGVHALMYPYFTLHAMNITIPRRIANVITFLQLAQMIAGVLINLTTSYLYYFHSACHRHPVSIRMIWLAYGSFAFLFGQLFYRLVLKKNDKKKSQ